MNRRQTLRSKLWEKRKSGGFALCYFHFNRWFWKIFTNRELKMRYRESEIQKGCIAWFRLQYPRMGRMLFAVPNGGYRNAREAGIMKAEGVTPGVADVILLIPRNGFGALCIEFKTPRGRQTDLQREWQELTERHGNRYAVCRSFGEFKAIVERYLDGKA